MTESLIQSNRPIPGLSPAPPPVPRLKPRLGFLGVGWIGLNRLQAIAENDVGDVIGICDASTQTAQRVASNCPRASVTDSLQDLLKLDLDGLVIATPSALHAEQTIQALRAGLAVFCQKPLGRNAEETRQVLAAAEAADRLLGVDLSYRYMAAANRAREAILAGELGSLYAADLVFHNAYGPDKPWFYDPKLSGGGCVVDLGTHLVDFALWSLGWPQVTQVTSRLFANGQPLQSRWHSVEDYAEARIDLESGITVRMACSWKLSAGVEAAISGSFYGTKGAVEFRNVNGSFYDFVCDRFRGTHRERLIAGPDPWGGRAAVAWVEQLACHPAFDPSARHLIQVAETLDGIYTA